MRKLLYLTVKRREFENEAIDSPSITKRLRQIRNAWHSQVILSFVFKVQWFRLGAGVAHYLTQR